MEGAHDMGGVAWSGPVRARTERAGVSRRMGTARLRDHAGDGDARRLEHRHVALRPRGSSARGLSQHELLPDLARRPRAADAGARPRRVGRDRGRTAAASGKASGEDADARRRRGHAASGRTDRARRRRARPLRGWRPRPCEGRSIRRPIRGCRATCAGISASSRCCTVVHVFPDTNATGAGEDPQWLYTVTFDGRELWGRTAIRPRLKISVDAWESYLEPA